MEDFKQYINPQSDDAERAVLAEIARGLEGLALEQKVAVAATALQALRRNRHRRNTIILVIGLLVAGALAWLLFKPQGNSAPMIGPAKQLQSTPQLPNNQLPVPSLKSVGPPVAERKQTSEERFEKPLMRGLYADLDTASVQLLEDLLRESVQNPGKFRTNSDWQTTLRLIREGRPKEAKLLVIKMEKQSALLANEANWLLGITLLAEGKMAAAAAVFEKIGRTEGHPRRAAAQRALGVMEEK